MSEPMGALPERAVGRSHGCSVRLSLFTSCWHWSAWGPLGMNVGTAATKSGAWAAARHAEDHLAKALSVSSDEPHGLIQ